MCLDQINDLNLRLEDEEQIGDIIENPIGIIILGSKSWAKAVVVNELLGYELLPTDSHDYQSGGDGQSSGNWRTIRMMYGAQTQVSLAVANHYELVEHLAIYDRVWHQIPAADLEIRPDNNEDDPGYSTATLEIKLPHHLLADDVQIIVAPSTYGSTSFENVHHICFEGITPIVVYALTDSDSLSAHEVDDLMELRRLEPRTAVFFIRANRQEPDVSMTGAMSPSPHHNVTAASELTESQQHLFFSKKDGIHSPPGSPTLMSHSPPSTSSQLLRPGSPIPQVFLSPKAIPTPSHSLNLFQQLSSLGFLQPPTAKLGAADTRYLASELLQIAQPVGPSTRRPKVKKSKDGIVPSELVENFDNFPSILLFVRQVLQSHLVRAANCLHALHMRCLRVFILTAFDMTRDMMVTPKRIEYARQKEQQLFDSLMAIANRKQEEIKHLINETLSGMRQDLLEECGRYHFKANADRLNTTCCMVHTTGRESDPEASLPIRAGQERESSQSSNDSVNEEARLAPARPPVRPNSAAGGCCGPLVTSSPSKISARDYQVALSEIQDFVLNHLNTAIAGKLIGSVDYLRDSYVGTLERCLASLEKYAAVEAESPYESLLATNALKQILNAAYQVEINIKATSSLLRAVWEKIKQIVTSSMLWRTQVIVFRVILKSRHAN